MLSVDDRVEMVMLEAWGLLPSQKIDAYVTAVTIEDLGAKHGSYSPDTGVIALSHRIFYGATEAELQYIDIHGEYPAKIEPYCSRALHVCLHEMMHAIGYSTGADRTPEWLALSGWEQTWKDRHTTGRYFERRPGWGEQGGSTWVYRKGTWFCREYSSKSPYEDYADTGTHIALGWHQNIQHPNGRAKIKYLLRHAWGQTELDRLDAVTAQWRHRLRDYL